MRNYVVTRAALLLCMFGVPAACIGCESANVGESPVKANSSVQELTVFECNDRLATCVSAAKTISDLTACNQAYGTCLLGSAEDFIVGLPGELLTAISDVGTCTTALDQ